MKRYVVSALLPLWIWAGCGENTPPNTSGNCKGLITVNLNATGGVNGAKSIASTLLNADGVRYEQIDTPPLALPSVILRLKDQYQPGNEVIRVATADGDPSKGTASSPAAVTAVGRTSVNFAASCPSVTLALTATSTLDVCFDRCDSDVRCGGRPFTGLEACQDECRQHAADFTQQQADWTAQYSNATDVINKLEGCNFVACSAIETCGETVMKGAIPKP